MVFFLFCIWVFKDISAKLQPEFDSYKCFIVPSSDNHFNKFVLFVFFFSFWFWKQNKTELKRKVNGNLSNTKECIYIHKRDINYFLLSYQIVSTQAKKTQVNIINAYHFHFFLLLFVFSFVLNFKITIDSVYKINKNYYIIFECKFLMQLSISEQ